MSTDRPFLSIVIPAHNEEGNIVRTCDAIFEAFAREGIADIEVVVVNDNSTDGTEESLRGLCARHPAMRYVNNVPPHGFGYAVRRGLQEFTGEYVAIVMADLSDAPEDMIQYYRKAREGWDCVFGSRFIKGSRVVDYPRHKIALNRMANAFCRMMFGLRYNDVTNAFKCYRRTVIAGAEPILACHFNLTVELPLKAITRGYSYCVVPISWTNRAEGISKLKIKEMGSRYLFIVLYVWLERSLTKGDYHKSRKTPGTVRAGTPDPGAGHEQLGGKG